MKKTFIIAATIFVAACNPDVSTETVEDTKVYKTVSYGEEQTVFESRNALIFYSNQTLNPEKGYKVDLYAYAEIVLPNNTDISDVKFARVKSCDTCDWKTVYGSTGASDEVITAEDAYYNRIITAEIEEPGTIASKPASFEYEIELNDGTLFTEVVYAEDLQGNQVSNQEFVYTEEYDTTANDVSNGLKTLTNMTINNASINLDEETITLDFDLHGDDPYLVEFHLTSENENFYNKVKLYKGSFESTENNVVTVSVADLDLPSKIVQGQEVFISANTDTKHYQLNDLLIPVHRTYSEKHAVDY